MGEGIAGENSRQSSEKIAKRPGKGKTESRIVFTDGERNLGQGNTSPLPVVAKEVVHVDSGKKMTFAVKHYFDPGFVTRSLRNYKRAKDAGLPVPTTLRRVDDTNHEIKDATLIATDLSEGGRKVVESFNNKKIEGKNSVRLDRISNMEDLLESLKAMALRAADHGIRLPADSLFFVFESGDSSRVECKVGDFESAFRPERDEIHQDLYGVNLEHIFLSLQGWLLYRNLHQKVQLDRKSILRSLDEGLFIKHWGVQDEDIPLPLSLKIIEGIRRFFRRN